MEPGSPELRLIGSIVADPSLLPKVMEEVRLEDFINHKARKIYAAAIDLAKNNKPIDAHTLADASGEHKLIADLYEETASGATWEYWAERVIYQAKRARLASALRRALSDVDDGEADADVIAARIIRESARDGDQMAVAVNIEVAASLAMDASQEAHNAGDIPGARTGFRWLDDKIGGLREGRMMTIAGVTGSGKSSLMVNMMLSAVNGGASALIFSLEMTAVELAQRMASQIASIDSGSISKGNLTPDEWARYVDACNMLTGYGNRLMIRSGSASSDIVAAELLRMKTMGMMPDIVAIDHINLASAHERGTNKYEKTCRLTSSLKQLALDHNISIIALSQLSRAVGDGRPQLYHLRDSGSSEQDSDIVLFIWHKPDGEVKLLLEKNRGGPTGEIAVKWIPHLTKFAEISRSEA